MRIENFCKNIMVSISNLENNQTVFEEKAKLKQALIRQKQVKDLQNCLTCGGSELDKVSYDFIPRF